MSIILPVILFGTEPPQPVSHLVDPDTVKTYTALIPVYFSIVILLFYLLFGLLNSIISEATLFEITSKPSPNSAFSNSPERLV
tara:strand:- start:259 stop:507 length:249 start_codon:yes stop_codon:yes gene_type:complete